MRKTMEEERENGEVVVVIGGNEFLGQHIIRLVQEQRMNMKEIRVVSQEKYNKNLDYEDVIPVVSYKADTSQLNQLLLACEGADCVFHAAEMWTKVDQKVNKCYTDGTRNVIEACIQAGVPRLVFTSSTKVVIGCKNDVLYSTESRVKIPANNRFLFGECAKVQYEAEKLVLEANGREFTNGKGFLHTLSLRPTEMYGELDFNFITRILRLASRWGGTLIRVETGDAFLQTTYAGNVAWAHIVGMDKLRLCPEAVGGESFFITDDTVPANIYPFAKPFLSERGFTVSSMGIPYYLMYFILSLISLLAKLVYPFHKTDIIFPGVHILHYIGTTYFFNRIKATLTLGYKPLYTWEKSLTNSLKYYKDVKLG